MGSGLLFFQLLLLVRMSGYKLSCFGYIYIGADLDASHFFLQLHY